MESSDPFVGTWRLTWRPIDYAEDTPLPYKEVAANLIIKKSGDSYSVTGLNFDDEPQVSVSGSSMTIKGRYRDVIRVDRRTIYEDSYETVQLRRSGRTLKGVWTTKSPNPLGGWQIQKGTVEAFKR